MFAVEWHIYLNIIYKFTLKLFYLMIFVRIIYFEFPCVAGARITDPKHEELVLNAIASNPQARFDFFSDFHSKDLGVRFPNSVLKFRIRIDGLCLR